MTEETTKRGRGRPTNEESSQVLKEQLAARKAVHVARKKAVLKKKSSHGGKNAIHNRMVEALTEVDSMPAKVDKAIDGLLNGLIEDTSQFIVWGGARYDNKNNQERKNLLNIVKDEITVIRSLRELREVLKDEKAQGLKQDMIANQENVSLLEDAKKRLEAAGINPKRLDTK